MKVLVIPDVHLKPWMFNRAEEIMKSENIEQAVCLMDIADDWKQQYNIDLYIQTYDRAIKFHNGHPNTLWCYGNHDVCYPWRQRESGFSVMADYTVCTKLAELERAARENIAFIHRIDNALFMHGGLSMPYVKKYIDKSQWNDVDAVVSRINKFTAQKLWQNESLLWFRPSYSQPQMYKESELIQVIGHTPVSCIKKIGSLICCDVFSTDSTGRPIGTQEFPIVDTESGEWYSIR